MSTTDLQTRINHRVAAFANDVASMLQDAVNEALSGALPGALSDVLSGAVPAATPAKRRKKAKRKRKTKTTGKRATKAAPKAKASAKGRKRTSAEIDKVKAALVREIKRNPGSNMESIGKAVGMSTKDLRRPIDQLIADKKLKKTGERRATRYRVA